MLNFTPVREKQVTMAELTAGFTAVDLAGLTDEMIDTVLRLIEGCTDEDIVFVPVDPKAHDAAASDGADVGLAWTLGHVIVHITASSEESAALAAEMARGVERSGRSRWETPWETVTTMEQVYQRLEESRRMRLASLGMWPDEPHFDLDREYSWMGGRINAVSRFAMGLLHDDDHLGQIEEIVRQAKAARVLA